MNKVAVVILSWNCIGYLKMFLGDVVRHSTDNDTIVCVADNGSTDGSPDWVSENFKDVKLIRLDKNHGFAGGYNIALSRLDARYFVLLNSDIEVTENWLSPLIGFMDKNPDVASCQPKIRSFRQKDHFEYAGAAGGFIDKYGFTFCRGRLFDMTEMDKNQYDDRTDIFWSSGACMVVRSEAWDKCNGFDKDFFAHMEEVDLCWRFHSSGYRVSYIPESMVYHVGGGVLPYNSELKTYLNFRNNLFLLYKNLPDNNLHLTLFIRKLFDGVAAAVFLIKGRPGSAKAVWRAHIDYYKSLKSLKDKRNQVKEMAVLKTYDYLLNKSIVFEFYIKGNKTYNSLRGQN